MVVAVIALTFALAGTAIAGPDAITSAVTKSKVKQIAKKQGKKQANKQIRKKAPGLSVANAVNAQNAINANTANTAGTIRQSSVTTLVSSPASAGFFTANTLALPAGTYLVFARAAVDNDAATDQDVTCRLVVGAQNDETTDLLEINGDDDTDSIALMVPDTLAATGAATFECNNPGAPPATRTSTAAASSRCR